MHQIPVGHTCSIKMVDLLYDPMGPLGWKTVQEDKWGWQFHCRTLPRERGEMHFWVAYHKLPAKEDQRWDQWTRLWSLSLVLLMWLIIQGELNLFWQFSQWKNHRSELRLKGQTKLQRSIHNQCSLQFNPISMLLRVQNLRTWANWGVLHLLVPLWLIHKIKPVWNETFMTILSVKLERKTLG